ncbi:hypothetical protein H5119_12995 [Pseudoalteromonas sp. SG45-5]|uniref:DUF6795 domain-containing protein n=1 Tax=unclassified Pseudoalteromonas TaxID=194690 RepID=UPI0015F9A8D1|nr:MULTISPECIES: DUF6795 domain-containing protein [unclassified Pseudoalteromonas]MBB1386445.1 hypothetical protein [Pseudoalteromonas sp. SG45-5]MBB1394485.1 hypothetical protein [Pseudoalteromonas sp. SG44-4]MBB1446897.1 hypothetical protein [Pseudoalteromonas sp. SG41-6]
MSFSEILRKLNNYIGTHKVHLCPEIKGRLVNNGTPLANVKISRSLSYSDGKYTKDECFADSNGEFEMPEMSLRSSQPALLIAERFTFQRIFVHNKNEVFLLWSSENSGINTKPEYANKLRTLNGYITDEEILFSFKDNHLINEYNGVSICRWKENFQEVNNDDLYKFIDQDSQTRIKNIST